MSVSHRIWRLLNVMALVCGLFMPVDSMYGIGLQVLFVTLVLLPPIGLALLAWLLYGYLSLRVVWSNTPYVLLWLRVVCLVLACTVLLPLALPLSDLRYKLFGILLNLASVVSSCAQEAVTVVQYNKETAALKSASHNESE